MLQSGAIESLGSILAALGRLAMSQCQVSSRLGRQLWLCASGRAWHAWLANQGPGRGNPLQGSGSVVP